MNLSFLEGRIGGFPVWVWGLIVVGGGLALAWVIRRGTGAKASSVTGGTLGQASIAPTDPNIDPYTGVPYTIESQINPSTGLPAYYGGPGVDASASPGSSSGTYSLTTRAAGSIPSLKTWDQQHPQGIIARSTPSGAGSPITVPYGSSVQISGPPIAGQFSNGTALWYPLASGGYISAVDVASQGGAIGGATVYQATPYWPQMLDVSAATAKGAQG